MTGPVLGSGRIVGLGGAYTALATGVEGAPWNAAAYASRGLRDIDWLEWDVTFNVVPALIRDSDFDNDGESGFTYEEFQFASVGLGVQLGDFGLGAVGTLQSYDMEDSVQLLLQVYNAGAGHALSDGQIVLGLGMRAALLSITRAGSESLVDVVGVSPEAGVLLRPAGARWRLGLAARLPVESNPPDARVAAGRTLPRGVRMPWEVQLGAALQLGPRPLNRKWVNPHDLERSLRAAMLAQRAARQREQFEHEALAARLQLASERSPPRMAEQHAQAGVPTLPEGTPRDPEFWRNESRLRWQEERELLERLAQLQAEREAEVRALSRRYLLLSAEAILVGPSPNAVGLESFLSQREHVSGRRATVGVRFGIEGEPIPHWMQMRAGTYLEPSRYDHVPYRAHGTAGLDLRLFSWDLFGLIDEFTLRIGASADVAERYLNVGLGLGLWH